MQYLTDENKNITHVVISIDEWNQLQEQLDTTTIINPYTSVIEYVHQLLNRNKTDLSLLGTAGLSAPSFSLNILDRIKKKDKKEKVSYRILLELLEGYTLPSKKFNSKILKIQLKTYSFVSDTISIAVGYIVRNDEFYTRLSQSSNGKVDEKLKKEYGFDAEKFFNDTDNELLSILKDGDRYDFIFASTEHDIKKFFSLTPIKLRIRKEPELLRFFYYDLFRVSQLISTNNSSFEEIFKKYPLVDVIAKAVYTENTLSGATSRVYKARKEAETIVQEDWKKYVEPIT